MSELIRDDESLRELGCYTLTEKIGEGGMGTVHLAVDRRTGRRVAVKVLSGTTGARDGARRRFRREAESVLGLDHPNLIRGFEAGEDRGRCYYAMEYCDGESLDRRLRREGRLPWREALSLLVPVIAALRYAHDRGLIHRDIKPSNLMSGKDGSVKVLDLGLSKNLVDLDEHYRTQTGLTVGTPHYMAPEQARGAKDIDGRADLYALGATMYHLVTGRTPFPGSSPIEVIAQHVHAPLPDPRAIVGDLPESVVHIVRRMMAQVPDDRYRDCAALSADVEAVLAGRPPLSPPPVERVKMSGKASNLPGASRRAPPRRARFWIAVAGTLLAAAGFGIHQLSRPALPRADASRARGGPSPAEDAAAPLPENWKPDVDLLARIDPRRHALSGRWSQDQGNLISDRLAGCRIQIPYEPPEEYDFRVEFTRLEGQDEIVQICSKSGSSFAWSMDHHQDRTFGFSAMVEAPTPGPVQTRAVDPLVNGRRYVSLVQVRKDGCKAYLNGWRVGAWSTDFTGSRAGPVWSLLSDRALGLGAQESVVAFHRAELREVTGRGRAYDPPRYALNFTPLAGGKGGSTFEEVVGLPLAGLRYSIFQGAGPPVVRFGQALYRRGDGSLRPGVAYGNAIGPPREVVARPGYAIGAMTLVGDTRLRGFKATMMGLRGSPPVLDPSDAYEEPWRGQPGGPGEVSLQSGTEPILGIHGRCGADIDALGLIWLQRFDSANLEASGPEDGLRDPASGLLGHWEFDLDRDRRVRDSSRWRQDGFVLGPPKWSMGKVGRALDLGGPEAGVIVPALGFDAGSVSVASWIRTETTTGKPQRYVSTFHDAFILGCDASGFLTFSVKIDGRLETVRSTEPAASQVWHHAAGTWDGKSLVVYKDGRPVGRREARGSASRDRGCRFGDDQERMTGLIDDVRIYERALPPGEVRRIVDEIPERMRARDADQPGELVQGVLREFFTGPLTRLSELGTRTPAQRDIAERPDFSLVKGIPGGFGLRFSGFIDVPSTGFYTFTHAGYDASALRIGATEVFSSPGTKSGFDKTGSIALKAGKHAFTAEVVQSGGVQQFYMLWESDTLPRQEIPPRAYGIPISGLGASRASPLGDPPPLLVKEGFSFYPGAAANPGSLVLVTGWDGETEATERAGKHCIRLKENRVSDVRHLYLAIQTRWDPGWRPAEIEVEYLDEGEGSFWIEYDGALGEYQSAASRVQVLHSGQWKIARLLLPDAEFRGRQNNGGDFRLIRPQADLWIHRVTLRAGHTSGIDPTPAAPPPALAPDDAGLKVGSEGFITDWLVLGPIPLEKEGATYDDVGQKKVFDRKWLPELPAPGEGDSVTLSGRRLSWKRVRSEDGAVTFLGEGSLFLALAYIDSPRERSDVTLRIGSDDGSMWRLNGTEVLRVYAARPLARDQNASPESVTLKKGLNVLLAEVINIQGPGGACARFVDRAGVPVTDLRLKLRAGR